MLVGDWEKCFDALILLICLFCSILKRWLDCSDCFSSWWYRKSVLSIQISLHQVIVIFFLLEITALIGFRYALPQVRSRIERDPSPILLKRNPQQFLKINALYRLKRLSDACKLPQDLRWASRIISLINLLWWFLSIIPLQSKHSLLPDQLRIGSHLEAYEGAGQHHA